MKILLIEDELLAAKKLTLLLEEIDSNIEIVGSLDTVESSIKFLEDHPVPDLIISDIHLADGLCFSIFSERNIACPIIFATAYDKYAIQAFEVNGIDYLLKPVQKDRLQLALDKFKKLVAYKPNDQHILYEEFKSLLADEKQEYKTRFLCKIGNKIKSVPTTSIRYFYSLDKMTFICDKNGNKIPVNNTLDEIDQLVDPKYFFRLNRKYVAHYESIDEVHTYFKGRVKIHLAPAIKDDIVVSSERTPLLKSWLDQ